MRQQYRDNDRDNQQDRNLQRRPGCRLRLFSLPRVFGRPQKRNRLLRQLSFLWLYRGGIMNCRIGFNIRGTLNIHPGRRLAWPLGHARIRCLDGGRNFQRRRLPLGSASGTSQRPWPPGQGSIGHFILGPAFRA